MRMRPRFRSGPRARDRWTSPPQIPHNTTIHDLAFLCPTLAHVRRRCLTRPCLSPRSSSRRFWLERTPPRPIWCCAVALPHSSTLILWLLARAAPPVAADPVPHPHTAQSPARRQFVPSQHTTVSSATISLQVQATARDQSWLAFNCHRQRSPVHRSPYH
ncbi:hypothetical protein U9M48_001347 [Paspalum notatum var. saurae]|uniref:Uncharacterized protein n=1 Tax=Paspalum notatum var. saurae TaxID=547442 RepID=A0AAQ3PG92_PASNO